MTIDLKKDREIAEAATPGPWKFSQSIDQRRVSVGVELHLITESGPEDWHLGKTRYARAKNAEHIATFNPSHAIEYIDTVEKQARAIEVMREALESIQIYGYPSRRGSRLGLVCEFDRHIDLSRTALSQAREIIGQAVSEKGDE